MGTVGTLIDGLPVLTNTHIAANLQEDKFTFKAYIGRNKDEWPMFELALDKVDNVQIVQKRETSEVTEQSAAGMIIGAALFGSLGARVGGRAKTREKIQDYFITLALNIKINHLFRIDYTSDEQKQIILDVSEDLKGAEKVVKQFRELRPSPNTNSVIQL